MPDETTTAGRARSDRHKAYQATADAGSGPGDEGARTQRQRTRSSAPVNPLAAGQFLVPVTMNLMSKIRSRGHNHERVRQALRIVVLLSCLPSASAAQSVDVIVAQALRAKGGVERIQSVRGLTMRGTMKADGLDVPMTLTTLRPHYFRQEAQVQGATVVQAFDGERAWVLNPLVVATPQALPDEHARRMKDQADFDGPLLETARKGIVITFDKFERIEGRGANCLRIARAEGPVQRLCLDADSGLELRSSVEIDEEGRKVRIDTLFSDYRTVDGLTLPFRVRTLVNGRPQSQLVIDRVELESNVDTALFKMP